MGENKQQGDRRCPRIPLQTRVFYTLESKYKEEVKEGELENITDGVGGICFKVAEQPAVESNVVLEFDLPDSSPLLCTGKIVWTKEAESDHYLVGVKFDLDEYDMEYFKTAFSL